MKLYDRRESLSRIIRHRRSIIPLTRRELAETSGLSVSYLGRIETGARFPSAYTLCKIAKPLRFREQELLILAGYMSPELSMPEDNPGENPVGQLDARVAKALTQEPLEVQRAILTMLPLLKSIGVEGMAELKVPQLTPEMAHRQALASMGRSFAVAIQALVDKFGSQEALQILGPYVKEAGKERGATASMMGFTSNDAIAIASFIHLFENQVLLIEGRPTEVSPDRVVKEITGCPYQNFPPEFCLVLLTMLQGFCEAINPEYKLTLLQCMSKGDPICQWIVEKK